MSGTRRNSFSTVDAKCRLWTTFQRNRISSNRLRTVDLQPSLSPGRDFSNRATAGQYKLAKNRERKTFELESLTIYDEKQFSPISSTASLMPKNALGRRKHMPRITCRWSNPNGDTHFALPFDRDWYAGLTRYAAKTAPLRPQACRC